jgi:hypothetical protein
VRHLAAPSPNTSTRPLGGKQCPMFASDSVVQRCGAGRILDRHEDRKGDLRRRVVERPRRPGDVGNFKPRNLRLPCLERQTMVPNRLPLPAVPQLSLGRAPGRTQRQSHRLLTRSPSCSHQGSGVIAAQVMGLALRVEARGRTKAVNRLVGPQQHLQRRARVLRWLSRVDRRRVCQRQTQLQIGGDRARHRNLIPEQIAALDLVDDQDVDVVRRLYRVS